MFHTSPHGVRDFLISRVTQWHATTNGLVVGAQHVTPLNKWRPVIAVGRRDYHDERFCWTGELVETREDAIEAARLACRTQGYPFQEI